MSEERMRMLRENPPTFLWIQHEFGFFGSKVPLLNTWPKMISSVRNSSKNMKIFITAHTVLPPDFEYPVRGTIFQKFLRILVNRFLIKSLRRGWMWSTFEHADAVFVHSQHQADWIMSSGVPTDPKVIPHYVPPRLEITEYFQSLEDRSRKRITVFGYQSTDKGQDIAIAALEHLRIDYNIDAELVIAGGARREEDKSYSASLLEEIRNRDLESEVKILGFIPESKLGHVYEASDVILAPFRFTSGSGSLVRALAQGSAVVASDLLLNLEIAERSPGSLCFFQTENPQDCARAIAEVLQNDSLRSNLKESAQKYAKNNNLHICAELIANHITAGSE